MKKTLLIKILLVIIAGVFAMPHFVQAESVFLTSDRKSYKIGEYVRVTVSVDTGENMVNAIQGKIGIPQDCFEIQGIKTGQSVFTLWPEKPAVDNSGAISFAGGVPHGFKSSNGNVLTFTLKTIKSGEFTLEVSSTKVLLNDGAGTQLANLSLVPLKIFVEDAITQKAQELTEDKENPLPFAPVVSQSLSPESDKYFVSFSATDKDSGIDHYEIREEYVLVPFWGTVFSTGWRETKTPYVLSLQHWWSKIYVRAYDSSGNFLEETVTKDIDETGNTILKASSVTLITVLLLFGNLIIKIIPTVL